MAAIFTIEISSHPTTLQISASGSTNNLSLSDAYLDGYAKLNTDGSLMLVGMQDGYSLTAQPKTGYDFLGWFTFPADKTAYDKPYLADATTLISSGATITKSFVESNAKKYNNTYYCIYPKYERQTYTVTLDPNGGSVSPTSIVVGTGDSVALPTPTWAGGGIATFLGWHDGSKYVSSTYTPTQSITLTAQWKIAAATGNLYITDGDEPVAVGSYTVYRDTATGNYTIQWSVLRSVSVPGLGECTFQRFIIHNGSDYTSTLISNTRSLGSGNISSDAYVRAVYRYASAASLLYGQSGNLIYSTAGNLLYGNPPKSTNAEGDIYAPSSSFGATITLSWDSQSRDLDILAYWDSVNSGSPKVGYNNVAPGTVNGYTINWSGDNTSYGGSEVLTVERSTSIPGNGVIFVHLNFYGTGSVCTVTATQNGRTITKNNCACGTQSGSRATTADPYVKVIFVDGVLNSIETSK